MAMLNNQRVNLGYIIEQHVTNIYNKDLLRYQSSIEIPKTTKVHHIIFCELLILIYTNHQLRWSRFSGFPRHIKSNLRRSQSPESITPNVRVSNPRGQSQSRVKISTGCRETMKRRQRVSNQESVTLGSWEEDEGTRRKTESQQQRVGHPGRRIQEPPRKQKVNNKESVTQTRVSHP